MYEAADDRPYSLKRCYQCKLEFFSHQYRYCRYYFVGGSDEVLTISNGKFSVFDVIPRRRASLEEDLVCIQWATTIFLTDITQGNEKLLQGVDYLPF